MGARAKFRLPPLCPSAIRLGRLTGAATVRAARRSRANSEAIPLLSNFAPHEIAGTRTSCRVACKRVTSAVVVPSISVTSEATRTESTMWPSSTGNNEHDVRAGACCGWPAKTTS